MKGSCESQSIASVIWISCLIDQLLRRRRENRNAIPGLDAPNVTTTRPDPKYDFPFIPLCASHDRLNTDAIKADYTATIMY